MSIGRNFSLEEITKMLDDARRAGDRLYEAKYLTSLAVYYESTNPYKSIQLTEEAANIYLSIDFSDDTTAIGYAYLCYRAIYTTYRYTLNDYRNALLAVDRMRKLNPDPGAQNVCDYFTEQRGDLMNRYRK
jgi:hypothetical protein